MTREEILDALAAMLPGQFDLVVAKLAVPSGLLPGAAAPQATRAVDVVRYVEARGRLEELETMLRLSRAHAPARVYLAHARRLIDATGYHRRDAELATLEAEAAAMIR